MEEPNNETIDSTNDTVEVETTDEEIPTEESTETEVETIETDTQVDVEQLQATNKKLFERAKKAEAEAKALKASKTAPSNQKASLPVDVDERILLAQGVDEELIDELKLRASKYGGSIIKAQKDPRYIAVKEQFEKEKKTKESSLPASRGSGGIKPRKTVSSEGLSPEEHKKLALEAMGKL